MSTARSVKALLSTAGWALLLVLALAAIWWVLVGQRGRQIRHRQVQAIPVPTEPLSLSGAPLKGQSTAPVVIMEFTDFECPFCRQFEAQTMPTIQSDYIDKGIVQLAFRHLPLTTIHPAAMGAAKATLCAGQQHHFWQLHDVLFAPTAPLNDDTYRAYVVEAKLNRSQYEACVGGWAADQIARDVAMAAALRISTTPSFVIGAYRPDGTVKASRVFRGAKPLEGFRLAIQEVLRTVQE